MAIVTVPQFSIPSRANQNYSFGSQAMTASSHIVAFLVQAPKTGTIEKVRFRLSTTTTGDTLRVSFQDVDFANGNPDGTVDQYRDVTIVNTDDNVIKETGLITSNGTDVGSPRSVTAGDLFFVCFSYPSYVAGSIQISNQNISENLQAYQAFWNGSTWAKTSSAAGVLGFIYSGGELVASPGGWLINSVDTLAFNSGSTPDERACKFSLPVSVRAIGVNARVDLDGATDIVLYDSNGTSVLASLSLDPDVRALTDMRGQVFLFNASVTLLANTNYYLAFKPTSVTDTRIQQYAFSVAGDRTASPFGTGFCLSTRTDGGEWTDDITRVVGVSLLCDGIDSGGSGGVPLIGPGGLVY